MDAKDFVPIALLISSILLIMPLAGADAGKTEFENPLIPGVGIRTIIQNITSFLFKITAVASLAAIMYGALRLTIGSVTSDAEVARAKQIIFWAVVALVTVGMATAILRLVRTVLF